MNSTAESSIAIQPAQALAKPKRIGFSYSLRGLLLVVVGIGFGLTALSYANDMLANVIFSGVLVVLLIAVLFGAFGVPARRPFWSGFAIFGVTYLVLTMGPWFQESVGPRLLSRPLLTYLNVRLAPAVNKSDVDVQYNGQWYMARMLDEGPDGKFSLRLVDVPPPNDVISASRSQFMLDYVFYRSPSSSRIAFSLCSSRCSVDGCRICSTKESSSSTEHVAKLRLIADQLFQRCQIFFGNAHLPEALDARAGKWFVRDGLLRQCHDDLRLNIP